MSPLCAQGAPAHTQTSSFTQSIASFLVIYTHSIVESSEGAYVLDGNHRRPYILPHSKFLSSPTTSIDLYGIFSPSSDLITSQGLLSPQLLSSRKLSLGSSSKCAQVLDSLEPWWFRYFDSVVCVSCTLDPLKFKIGWVINPTIASIAKEFMSQHPTNLFCLSHRHPVQLLLVLLSRPLQSQPILLT